MFKPAKKEFTYGRIALTGPSGSGKTYTALTIAPAFGEKIALIDTENGSASKYADIFSFDTANLSNYSPGDYIKAIKEAEASGYDCLIIDSLSHAWKGKGGVLELADKSAVKYRGNSWAGWRDATPQHNALIDAIVSGKIHIIVTMRAKTIYEIQENERGRKTPVKIGLAPVQREGLEFEFDVIGDMDFENNLIITKTRCHFLRNEVYPLPGIELGKKIATWLGDYDAISKDQVDQILKEIEGLKLDLKRVENWILRKWGIRSFSHLIQEQYDELIELLPKFAESIGRSE